MQGRTRSKPIIRILKRTIEITTVHPTTSIITFKQQVLIRGNSFCNHGDLKKILPPPSTKVKPSRAPTFINANFLTKDLSDGHVEK